MNYSIISESGDREENEDYALSGISERLSCFILCDGLGGHGAGDIASRIVSNTIKDYFIENQSVDNANISNAFKTAQNMLLNKQKANNELFGMRTTAAILLTDSNTLKIAHIGDTRVYVFYKNKIVMRTYDHSVPQMLVMTGEIKEKHIRGNLQRNILLRAMGMKWGSCKYEISEPRPVSKCQAFLLCSDGFWEYIDEKTMCRYLRKSRNSEEWINLMTEEVRKNGYGNEMDNYTAIAGIL